MIGYLQGEIIDISKTNKVILNVNGTGFEVNIPLSFIVRIGEKIALWIHTHVREDDIALYGFLSKKEKNLFQLLISVGGIGPKTALSIISAHPPEQLIKIIAENDEKSLSKLHGVGKKTAHRIVFEIGSKIMQVFDETDAVVLSQITNVNEGVVSQVLSALINLGFKKHDARQAIDIIINDKNKDNSNFETLLKESLAILYKKV